MKKFLVLMLTLLSGCATVSEYHKGCFDGVKGMRNMFQNPAFAQDDIVEYYCRTVDRNHDQEKRSDRVNRN